MREKPANFSASDISLLVVALLLLILTPLSSSIPRTAEAEVTTAISPTGGSGSLGTTITSGTSTIPTNMCTANCVITGGNRFGNNLFHSFGDFSIGALDSARFQTTLMNPVSDASVSNVLGRVTGANPSNIFGALDSATYYPSANLFLMNPNGIVFGPNATLNVGGSVNFTTADYLRMTDGGRFNANSNAIPGDLLTAAPVAAFGFLGSNPAAITFENGQLTVAKGTGLILVAGNINLVSDPISGTPSSITAPGKPILLTSVTGPGEVTAVGGVPAAGMALGTITLDPGTVISTAGDVSFGDGSGGAISIRGGQLVVTGTTITTSPAEGSAGTGGALTVDIRGSATLSDSFIQTGPILSSFAGSAGAVSITANEALAITNSFIDASAYEAGGDGGSVTLDTNGSLSLTDSFIGTFAAYGSAPANGGDVTIMGRDVTFTNSAVGTDVSGAPASVITDTPALGQVRPGAVTVTAENTVTFSGSLFGDPFIPVISASALGTLLDAGSVTITGKTINLSNGSINVFLDNSSSGAGLVSPGSGGAIEIRGSNMNLSQFILTSQNAGEATSTGTGGNILLRGADSLRADNIQLTNSRVDTASVTGGGAGNITFQTKALTLSDTQVLAETLGLGPGGSIGVHGAQTATLQSNSVISSSAVSSGTGFEGPFGAAGSILLETQQLTMQGGSVLKSADLPFSQGNAGSITVKGTNGPAQSILIDGGGTGIFTDAEGNGAGGSINLFANSVTLQNGGTISATTSGTVSTAIGGSITVNATDQVTMTGGALITAGSTGSADAGKIDISSPNGFTMRNSSITTEVTPSENSSSAGGGDIKITTSDSAAVSLVNSQIIASVADGPGGGGDISIDPQFVILQNSQILAQAAGGQGGNITITTNYFFPDANSLVNADSQFGIHGTVTILSPISNLAGTVASLPSSLRQSPTLQTSRCAAMYGETASSFIVAGRETIPTEPGGWMLASVDAGAGLTARGEGPGVRGNGVVAQDEGVGARGEGEDGKGLGLVARGNGEEIEIVSLRRLTPAGFLTQHFAEREASGCRS